MTTPICVICGRPTPDGYVDVRCGVDKPSGQLREIADALPAARDIAHRQTAGTGGGSTGKPGSTLPLDLGATARLDAVEHELVTLARMIADERGVPLL